jgi:hypothetical protein
VLRNSLNRGLARQAHRAYLGLVFRLLRLRAGSWNEFLGFVCKMWDLVGNRAVGGMDTPCLLQSSLSLFAVIAGAVKAQGIPRKRGQSVNLIRSGDAFAALGR